MIVYSNGKIRLVTTIDNDKRITLVWSLFKAIKGGVDTWVPFTGTFEDTKMSSEDFLLKNGISILAIGSEYTLIREETYNHNKFILLYNSTNDKILGSIFNKSNNELNDDIHIYNFIKYLEDKYI